MVKGLFEETNVTIEARYILTIEKIAKMRHFHLHGNHPSNQNPKHFIADIEY